MGTAIRCSLETLAGWIELIAPDQFVYPLKQRWFASATQMSNEPSYVDGGDAPLNRTIYYHYGLDIGGAEGLTEVLAATDGVVVSAAMETEPSVTSPPVAARGDVIYIRDSRNWYYRYSHLQRIDVRLGDRVSKGQMIGLLEKKERLPGLTCTSTSKPYSHLANGVSRMVMPFYGRPIVSSTSPNCKP